MHDLFPCVAFSPTENSYICKYLASEDISDSNMTVESQIKLWGNSIFHSGRLVSLCYWAQQPKATETMHVYNFLVMVYSFLGRGLLNVCFMVMKSIICVHIIICRHTPGQESTAWGKYWGHIPGCDKLKSDSNVSFLACMTTIFVLIMVLWVTPANPCVVVWSQVAFAVVVMGPYQLEVCRQGDHCKI